MDVIVLSGRLHGGVEFQAARREHRLSSPGAVADDTDFLIRIRQRAQVRRGRSDVTNQLSVRYATARVGCRGRVV
jgi:hypothetical protein